MSKYEKLNEPVFVNQISHQKGRGDIDIIEVQLTGIKTRTEYKSWIDPKFANYSHWELLIGAAQEKGVVVSNLKLKDPAKNLINADSRPRIEYVVTRIELAELLSDFWETQKEFVSKFGTF